MFRVLLSLALIVAALTSHASSVQSMDTIRRSKNIPRDTTTRFVKINRIFIIGNDITHDRIIKRELSLREGDIIYSADLPAVLELDQKKLINTRLFNTVSIRPLELEKDSYDLLVDLKERWYTFPSPIFDLADRNFNDWWQNYNHDFKRVNYGLRLYRFNMRGRNETLKFVAQFGFMRRFEMSYRIPNLDRGQKHGIALDFDYSEAKNVPVRTENHKLVFQEFEHVRRTTFGSAVTYSFRNSFYQTHHLKLEYRENQISDSVLLFNEDYLGNSRTKQSYGTLSYQFTSDRRDYIAYPLRGYFFNGMVGRSGLFPNDQLQRTEAFINYARFFDLGKGFYLSNNTVGYTSTPNSVPYYNFSALGYRKHFVRGYELYVIEGPSYAMNKTTFKKRVFSRTYHWSAMPFEQFRHIPLSIYLKTYGDLGYIENYAGYDAGARLTNKLISGGGFGIDIVSSYDVVLRFEYSINAENEKGFFFHIKKEF